MALDKLSLQKSILNRFTVNASVSKSNGFLDRYYNEVRSHKEYNRQQKWKNRLLFIKTNEFLFIKKSIYNIDVDRIYSCHNKPPVPLIRKINLQMEHQIIFATNLYKVNSNKSRGDFDNSEKSEIDENDHRRKYETTSSSETSVSNQREKFVACRSKKTQSNKSTNSTDNKRIVIKAKRRYPALRTRCTVSDNKPDIDSLISMMSDLSLN